MKFSQYNVVVEIENGLLLLNLKNSSYVKITKQPDLDKFKKMLKTNKLDKKDEMVSLLYQNGYIVSKNEDEYKVVYSKINEIVRK